LVRLIFTCFYKKIPISCRSTRFVLLISNVFNCTALMSYTNAFLWLVFMNTSTGCCIEVTELSGKLELSSVEEFACWTTEHPSCFCGTEILGRIETSPVVCGLAGALWKTGLRKDCPILLSSNLLIDWRIGISTLKRTNRVDHPDEIWKDSKLNIPSAGAPAAGTKTGYWFKIIWY
jgi:hypothetical protein